MDSSHALKKLKALETTLKSTPDELSSREIKVLLERAERLLQQSYMLKGVQSLIKKIISSKGNKISLFNHLVQLNLVYHFQEVKNRALAVERKARPDSNKRVDIVVFGQSDFYIELKNVNEPELATLKEEFAEKIPLPLSKIKAPYFVHFRFFRSQLQRLSPQNIQPLPERIEEEIKKGEKREWIPFPSQKEAFLSFSLEKSAQLLHCILGRYGYGEDWPYCLYSEEYLEKKLESEKKILEKPFPKEEHQASHLYNLKRYGLLRDNSPFLAELELKMSVLRGIRDSELKFSTPSENMLNILLLHFNGKKPQSMADTVAGDLARWYYSLGDERGEDRWREFYEIWAGEEGFQREGKIDAFVNLIGRGIEEPYQCKIVYARRDRNELERLLP
ncbi:MAG TPA: hypothetical protein ACFYEM_02800 [Candidatus Hypogeohydataceae bacterium YC40]